MTARLQPFFSFYGAKWRCAPLYPAPKHHSLIEPFAGSACYATLYYQHAVQLFDADPVICSVWDFLIRATDNDISAIPDWVENINDLTGGQEIRWLVGFWLGRGLSAPRITASAWKRSLHTETNTVTEFRSSFWGPWIKNRLRKQTPLIRHWTIKQSDYSDIPNQKATWFFDPPYQGRAGKKYRYSSTKLDYSNLAKCAISRVGQSIVCEAGTANWLPFTVLQTNKSSLRKNTNTEAMWMNEKAQD